MPSLSAYITCSSRVRLLRTGLQPRPPKATWCAPISGKGTTTAPIWVVTAGQPTTLHVQGLLLKPGAGSGWHAHSGSGTVGDQRGCGGGANRGRLCARGVHARARRCVVPAGVPHRVTNEGSTDADVVVTYTLPADAPVRDDAPAAVSLAAANTSGAAKLWAGVRYRGKSSVKVLLCLRWIVAV